MVDVAVWGEPEDIREIMGGELLAVVNVWSLDVAVLPTLSLETTA